MSAAQKPLGLWTAIALVVGSMIGSGVFLLSATLASFGAASLLGWGLTLFGALLLAIVYSWLSKKITRTGGSYAYAHEAFGPERAFLLPGVTGYRCGAAIMPVTFTMTVPILGNTYSRLCDLSIGSNSPYYLNKYTVVRHYTQTRLVRRHRQQY